MALTGFDPSLVNSSISSIKSAYQSLMTQLATNMQNDFVGGMADKWACKQAQTFFQTNFKPVIDNLIKNADEVFRSIVDSMNSAAQSWAADTDTFYSTQSLSVLGKSIDVSSIQENIGGVRGIDLEQANSVASKLNSIASNASTALEAARNAVNSCGFIGRGQAEALQASLTTIKNNMNSSITDLSTSIKSAISDTVTVYSDTAGKVQQAFSAS